MIDRLVTVVGRAPFGGGFAVTLGDSAESLDLGEQALTSIWIEAPLAGAPSA